MKTAKRAAGKPRSQIAALPMRHVSGSPEIMLVTSRTTRRWIVPKGWPIKGLKEHEAAAREAYEEAGVVGTMQRKPLGRYIYWKRMSDHFILCTVKVFRLDVERQLPSWAEQHQRRCEWFKPEDAADLVDEPQLATLIRSLAPRPEE